MYVVVLWVLGLMGGTLLLTTGSGSCGVIYGSRETGIIGEAITSVSAGGLYVCAFRSAEWRGWWERGEVRMRE
jgi:hypothetical protein